MSPNASIVVWVGCFITIFLVSLEQVDGNGPTGQNGKNQPLSKFVDNAKNNFGFDSNTLRKDGPLVNDILQYVRDRPVGRSKGQSIQGKKDRSNRRRLNKKISVCGATYILPIAIGNKATKFVKTKQLLKENPCIIRFQAQTSADVTIYCRKFKLKNQCNNESFYINDKKYCIGDTIPPQTASTFEIKYTRSASLKKKKKPKIKCIIKAIESKPPTTSTPSTPSTSSTTTPSTINRDIQYCPDTCGIAPSSAGANRIVGGSNAEVGEYPWVVSINLGDSVCGGSIINSRYILTAAHCFDYYNSSTIIEVGVGSIIINESAVYSSNTYYVHPDYDPNDGNTPNDIALIKLDSDIQFNDNVGPICLAPDDDYTGQLAVVAGWGLLEDFGTELAPQLQEVGVVVWVQSECVQNYDIAGISITNNQICASGLDKDSCSGDSGGPLFLQIGDRWSQIGLVSYGLGCADPMFPGVYTKPLIYKAFLDEHITSGVCP